MKTIVRIPATLCIMMISSCALYHLQTPETVPPGKISGGIGSLFHSGEVSIIPGAWLRVGITPRMDIGFHTLMVGLKVDGKYRFNDYFAFGSGLGGGLTITPEARPETIGLYLVEGSLYVGYPARYVTPYSVLRFAGMGSTDSEFVPMVSGVGGLRLRPLNWLSLYGEVGGRLEFYRNDNETRLIVGAGVSFGN